MHLDKIWRYPIKSLAGERLDHATLTSDGVAGDRVIHVRGAGGPLTGRTRSKLLSIPGRTGADGVPRVAGDVWHSPAAAATITAAAGPDAQLVAFTGPERFDVLNLLVATDGAVEAFGHDVRRLRPNLVIGGVPADAEATWPGRAISIGDALIGVHSVRQRCIVTSFDPDTGEQDLDVFRRIRNEFGNRLALNCWVIRPADVTGDAPVHIVATTGEPAHLGGWIVGAPYLR